MAVKSAAAKAASQVAVRTVVCLNGCPHPCAAALRDPGKSVIRFAE
jgi:predicted metal-binding protein